MEGAVRLLERAVHVEGAVSKEVEGGLRRFGGAIRQRLGGGCASCCQDACYDEGEYDGPEHG